MVGDLAQFMVTNGLDEAAVRKQADTLSFPTSVVEYFQGAIGVPHGGFPQPLAAQVVKTLPVFAGRPGAELPPLDLDQAMADLKATYGDGVGERALMSSTMYPKVFETYMAEKERYGDVSKLPTRAYIEPMELGEEIAVELQKGKTLGIKLVAVGELNAKEGTREVCFDFNPNPNPSPNPYPHPDPNPYPHPDPNPYPHPNPQPPTLTRSTSTSMACRAPSRSTTAPRR